MPKNVDKTSSTNAKETNAILTQIRQPCNEVINFVLDRFARHEIEVGDVLPSEREIAEELQVSRCSVREALKVLNYLGFVQSIQGSGNYMTDRHEHTTARILQVEFQRDSLGIRELQDFRLALERQAVCLAVNYITEQQITEMKNLVDVMEVTQDSGSLSRLDRRFHYVLAEASRNRLILENVIAIASVLFDSMVATHQRIIKTEEGFSAMNRMHRALVQALQDKDMDAADAALNGHYSLALRLF